MRESMFTRAEKAERRAKCAAQVREHVQRGAHLGLIVRHRTSTTYYVDIPMAENGGFLHLGWDLAHMLGLRWEPAWGLKLIAPFVHPDDVLRDMISKALFQEEDQVTVEVL